MSVKAIFGLGNPGDQYVDTRHNIGFKFINALRAQADTDCVKKVRLSSQIYSITVRNSPVVLVKPQTYMNLSGESVLAVMKYYKLNIDEICIVADDIDIDFQTIRVRKKGGAGTHNGLKSVIKTLGSQDFLRIRLGVGSPPEKMDLSSFVLQKFSSEEQDKLSLFLDTKASLLIENLTQTKDILMNRLNSI
jgi:peptidyl-tRNA hydrolase, PTH1 family